MKNKGKRISDTVECRSAQEVAPTPQHSFQDVFGSCNPNELAATGLVIIGALLGVVLGRYLQSKGILPPLPAKPTKSRKTVVPKKSRK